MPLVISELKQFSSKEAHVNIKEICIEGKTQSAMHDNPFQPGWIIIIVIKPLKELLTLKI